MSLRRSMRLSLALVLLMVVSPLLLARPQSSMAAAPTYTVTDLGTLNGTSSKAATINASGQVVGWFTSSAGLEHAFLYSGGTMTDLGTLGGDISLATGINDVGQIVGVSTRVDGQPHAFTVSNGKMVDIGTLSNGETGNRSSSIGLGINNGGQIVGVSLNKVGQENAFLYSGGTMTDLGTLGGGIDGSTAYGLNSKGQIVGQSSTEDDPRAFLWQNGTMSALTPSGSGISTASSINDAGQVVGYSSAAEDTFHASLWQGGQLTDLGTLGGNSSYAYGINSSGQIVGSSITADGAAHAFLRHDGNLVDLNTILTNGAGWELLSATAINDKGQIVGEGRINDAIHAFLLTPATSQPTPSASPNPGPSPSASPSPPSSGPRTFPETGFTVGGRFLTYWEGNGGLPIYGYPLTPERKEVLEDGKEYTVQYFERARFEYHPENKAPFDVLLGQFGRILHPADPPVAQQPGVKFHPETGHNVPADFQAFWDKNGGLPQFGYPLSEVIKETLEDGKEYEVQYFERARFERHPENQDPFKILLGQFGRRILANR